MNHSVELLSPAGSMDAVKAAFRFGADAVYLGGPYHQMRSESAGFTMQELEDVIHYAHALDKKVYITVNTLMSEKDISDLPSYIGILSDMTADAVIVSDLGAVSLIHRMFPGMKIHLSTQASVMNHEAALVCRSLGVSKIVLAREMTLQDIITLRKSLPEDLELEAFVHGAMCMAYSGRCLMSSFLLGRSANKGKCAQPCRWSYYLSEEKRPGQFFPVEQEGQYTMIMSSRDLCMIEHLDELMQAGVCSFKIEGRMKAEYYVATVTNAYRSVLNGTMSAADGREELKKISHRPYTTGFYLGELPDDHYNSGLYEQEWGFCGTVLSCQDGRITVRQRNKFSEGNVLNVLHPGKTDWDFTVHDMRNESGEYISEASHAMMTVSMPCSLSVTPGDMLRKKL